MAAPAINFRTTADLAGLRTLTREVDALQRNLGGASKSMTDTLAGVGKSMEKTGKKLTTSVTLPIVGAGVAAFSAFAGFETEMAKMQGLVGVSADEIDRLRGSLVEMGPAVGKGPDELARAMFFITSAGLEGAEAMEVLEMAAKGSAAGLGDTAVVADLATSAMNAYGSDILSATQATDTLTAAVRLGKLAPDELAGAMGKVLPIASAMGVNFDEVGAAMAAMSRTGTDASEAATSLRGIMTAILSPTSEANTALAGVGLSAEGLQASLREDGLLATLELVNESFGGNVEATEAVFGNVRALSGVMDMLGGNVEDTRMIFDDMTDVAGETEGAFAVVSDTAKFKLDSAIASLKGTFIEFGGAVAPIVERLAALIGRITERLKGLSPEQKQWAVGALAVAAAIGPVMLIGGKLIKTVLGIVKVVKALGVALSFLAANPVALIVIAIAALVAGVIYAYNNFEWFRNGVQTVWEAIQTAISWAWENVIKPVWDMISWYIENVLIRYVKILLDVYTAVFKAVAEIIGWVWENVIKPVWDMISWYFENVLLRYVNILLTVYTAVFKAVAAIIQWAWNNVIKPVWGAIQSFIGGVLVPAFNRFLAVGQAVWSGLSAAIGAAWGGISWVFGLLKDGIAGVAGWFGDRIDDVKRVFSTVKDAITSPFITAFNLISNAWNNTIGGWGIDIPDLPLIPGRGTRVEFPKMPTFRSGGIVPGVPGEPVFAMLHGGERVLRASEVGGDSDPAAQRISGDINVYVTRSDADAYDIGRELMWRLKVAG